MGEALERKRLNGLEQKPLHHSTGSLPHIVIGDRAFPLKTFFKSVPKIADVGK